MYAYLTELLTVQCHTHSRTSKVTATIRWTYRNHRTRVDSWKLRVRNLTWEQNDYTYDKKSIKCNGGTFTQLPIRLPFYTFLNFSVDCVI